MADNTPQQGTDTIASDDIGGVKYQRVKVAWGVDGAAVDASATNPLPVTVGTALPAGTNNIGDFDVATLPAADYTTDSLEAYFDPRYVVVAGSRIEVQYAVIDCATLGDNTIVTGGTPTSSQTLVLGYDLVAANGPVTVRWKSAATSKSGPKNLAGAGYGVAKSHPNGVLRCGTDEALILNLSGGTQIGGELSYVKLPV